MALTKMTKPFARNVQYTGDDGKTVRNLHDKVSDVVSVKDFGAVGDGATDDTAAIQAAINYGFTNSIPVVLEGKLRITETIRNFDQLRGCSLKGLPGAKLVCDFSVDSPALSIRNKTLFRCEGVNIEGGFSRGSKVTTGMDFVALTDSLITGCFVEGTGGQGIWVISGENKIVNYRVGIENCTVRNIQHSGIQIQGGSGCWISGCTATNLGLAYPTGTPWPSDGSATGVYFKVPIENSSITNCKVFSTPGVGFSVGTSFPGTYGKKLIFSDLTAVSSGFGVRVGEVEDSLFSNLQLTLLGEDEGGRGDGLRLETGCSKNTFRGINTFKVGLTRSGIRALPGVVNCTVELSGYYSSFAEGSQNAVTLDTGSSGNTVSLAVPYKGKGGAFVKDTGTENLVVAFGAGTPITRDLLEAPDVAYHT